MIVSAPQNSALRVGDLAQNAPTVLEYAPDTTAREAIARQLGLLSLRKLRFQARLEASGKRDWRLTGMLGATVVQPCVVSLKPVTTRIDQEVERRYIADLPTPDPASETEMPEDDSTEPLGNVIDPWAVMVEALSLALPLYPRHLEAESADISVTEPGKAPMTDADARPFAGLAALRDKLGSDESNT